MKSHSDNRREHWQALALGLIRWLLQKLGIWSTPEKPTFLQRLLNKVKCFFGFHDWSEQHGHRRCSRCSKHQILIQCGTQRGWQ
ncbi:hypothetical protein G3R49_19690 [Shewanella sp. WXL01]|uniref:hypothetical protein n=1 Tax=Shewanella sp. WXL01 TaxID=2709721 RepID=UPI0014382A17|nr:hypothetical protein [Shewanella sp. WXL01]NKF52783.1 hypothetical protein [Shewanella sp. WXL01]